MGLPDSTVPGVTEYQGSRIPDYCNTSSSVHTSGACRGDTTADDSALFCILVSQIEARKDMQLVARAVAVCLHWVY